MFNISNEIISKEKYRGWLVGLIKDHTVILVTVRLDTFSEHTLDSIRKKTGWLPDEFHFKPENKKYTRAPQWKKEVFLDRVLPNHGNSQDFLAIESNSETRAMYSELGIKSLKAPRQPWLTLPQGSAYSTY